MTGSRGPAADGPASAARPAGSAASARTQGGEDRPAVWVDGVRIGVDVGSVRVGVASSDPAGILASPLTTLARDPRGDADIVKLARLVAEREAVEVVVGLPRSLSGRSGPAVAAARAYADALAERVDPIQVRLSDERLTTVEATRRLAEAGTRGRKGRQVIDRSAAVLILQGWLDRARRNT